MDGAGHTDDIDHLGKSVVRCVGELLQKPIPYWFDSYGTCCNERMTIQEIESYASSVD